MEIVKIMEATPQRIRVVPVLSQESIIILIAALVIMSQIAGGMYTPQKGYYGDADSGLESGEDDDMDQTASTPKRNRGEGKSETVDGYEENEPDGSYEETPREQEGQADVEKFFDDHLGASERDGMDKENLPSNMAELIIQVPPGTVGSSPRAITKQDDILTSASEITLATDETPPIENQEPQQSDDYIENQNKQQQFIKLPNNRQVTTKVSTQPIQRRDDSSDECYECDEPKRIRAPRRKVQPRVGRRYHKTGSKTYRLPQEASLRESRANENNVVAIQNDDDDKIYVTNKTNQPFRIDALGGYDPEEDFKSASQDLEDPNVPITTQNQRRKSKDKQANTHKDMIFNEPENEGPYEDASETDEVTFNSDNPYKKEEMEDEIKSSASNKRDKKVEGEEGNEGAKGPSENDSEDTVKGWVNDGVEDMEIPSQTDQDIVLEKAARMEELAQERRDKEKEEQAQKDNEDQQPDEHSQRMPNADYMKNDMDDEFEDS